MKISEYITTLIEEKGRHTWDPLQVSNHIGLAYVDLINWIEELPEKHEKIRGALLQIDFCNGNVFHFLDYLAEGMGKCLDKKGR